jgi:hypothetical protein
LELKDESATIVGMIAETTSKLRLYIASPDMAEDHFNEEEIRADLNRYSQRLTEIQRELGEINGNIQGLAGIDSTQSG